MKRISLLVIVLTIMIFKANSQVHKIGAKSGINISTATSAGLGYTVGENYGFLYEVMFKDKYSLSVDLSYNQRGFEEKIQIVAANNYVPKKDLFSNTSSYLSLPIKFGYTMGSSNIKPFVSLGINPSFLLDVQQTAPIYADDLNSNGAVVVVATDWYSSFDIGGLIELGLCFNVNENVNLFTSALYSQSFHTFYNHSFNNAVRHSGFSLSFGFKYKIK